MASPRRDHATGVDRLGTTRARTIDIASGRCRAEGAALRVGLGDPGQDPSRVGCEWWSLLAQGLSNAGIAESLVITEKSVVEHVSRVYEVLQLPQTGNEHRRVLAVLRYLSR